MSVLLRRGGGKGLAIKNLFCLLFLFKNIKGDQKKSISYFYSAFVGGGGKPTDQINGTGIGTKNSTTFPWQNLYPLPLSGQFS